MFWFLFRLLFAGFLLLYSLIISRFEYKNRLLIGYGQWFSPLKMFDDDGARIGLNDDTAQSFLLAPPPPFSFFPFLLNELNDGSYIAALEITVLPLVLCWWKNHWPKIEWNRKDGQTEMGHHTPGQKSKTKRQIINKKKSSGSFHTHAVYNNTV